MAHNIEDTIFENTMACNPRAMVTRLRELLREHPTNDPKTLMQDTRIQRCMYLLCVTMGIAPSFNQGNMYDWYASLANEWRNEDDASEHVHSRSDLS